VKRRRILPAGADRGIERDAVGEDLVAGIEANRLSALLERHAGNYFSVLAHAGDHPDVLPVGVQLIQSQFDLEGR